MHGWMTGWKLYDRSAKTVKWMLNTLINGWKWIYLPNDDDNKSDDYVKKSDPFQITIPKQRLTVVWLKFNPHDTDLYNSSIYYNND